MRVLLLGVGVPRGRQKVGRIDVLDFHRDGMREVTGVSEGTFAVGFNIGVAVIRIIRVGVGHIQEGGPVARGRSR